MRRAPRPRARLSALFLNAPQFPQGFPVGLFFYAVPSWMAANGVGTAAVAAVVGAAALPWSLKLINGFLIVAVIGACILLFLLGLVKRRT